MPPATFACATDQMPDPNFEGGWQSAVTYYDSGCIGPHDMSLNLASMRATCSPDLLGGLDYQIAEPLTLAPNFAPPRDDLHYTGRVFMRVALWFDRTHVWLRPWEFKEFFIQKSLVDGSLSWHSDNAWFDTSGAVVRTATQPIVIETRNILTRIFRAAAVEWYFWWEGTSYNGPGSALLHQDVSGEIC